MAILSAPTHIAIPPVENPFPNFKPRRRLADLVGAIRTAMRTTPSEPGHATRPHPPGREDFLERAVMARAMNRL